MLFILFYFACFIAHIACVCFKFKPKTNVNTLSQQEINKHPPTLPKKPGSIKSSHSKIANLLAKQFEQNNTEVHIAPDNDTQSRPHANTISVPQHTEVESSVEKTRTQLIRQMSSSQNSIRSITSQSSIRSTVSQNSIQSNGSVRSTSSSSSDELKQQQPLSARFSFVPADVLEKLEIIRRQADADNLDPVS